MNPAEIWKDNLNNSALRTLKQSEVIFNHNPGSISLRLTSQTVVK